MAVPLRNEGKLTNQEQKAKGVSPIYFSGLDLTAPQDEHDSANTRIQPVDEADISTTWPAKEAVESFGFSCRGRPRSLSLTVARLPKINIITTSA